MGYRFMGFSELVQWSSKFKKKIGRSVARRGKKSWRVVQEFGGMLQRKFYLALTLLLPLYLLLKDIKTKVSSSGSTNSIRIFSEDSLLNRYSKWKTFNSKAKYPSEWYVKNCFGGIFSEDVEKILIDHVAQWSQSSDKQCQESYHQFNVLYEIHNRFSPKLNFPSAFLSRVKKWLNGDAVLLESVHRQNIIHLYHPLTGEHVVYNPVRARRPMPSSSINLHEWVNKQAEETAKNCDFCNIKNMTASDQFGRHETAYTIRVSNTFKVERWHSLVVTRNQHHPLNFSLPTFIAFFEDAWTFMKEVVDREPIYIYPNIAWDSLYQAGVSQLHPHIHMMLSPDHYYGFYELLRSAGQRYHSATGENYFSALLEVHEALGLTIHYGNSVAFPTLVGKSDMEVMFLAESPGEDFYKLVFFTVEAYHDTYLQLCKGFSGAYPALGKSENAELGRLPVVARLISRGDCTSPRTDYTSYEIFQIVYRNHDPWQVARAIRESIKKHDKKNKDQTQTDIV